MFLLSSLVGDRERESLSLGYPNGEPGGSSVNSSIMRCLCAEDPYGPPGKAFRKYGETLLNVKGFSVSDRVVSQAGEGDAVDAQ